MKFFVCKDSTKFGFHEYQQYGQWMWYGDDQVKSYQGHDYLVLYCGYLIEGNIDDAARKLSFHEENGNFFAVKLTPEGDYEIFLDYFNNHKVFYADKYGIEISNWLPFMSCNQSDIVREDLGYDYLARELTPEENTTYFNHINSYIPPYDYLLDCKQAWSEEKWDPDDLTEYIYECMSQHAEKIKSLYPKRFCALSEGIDSTLQSLFFKDDPQYGYNVEPCDAGAAGLSYKRLNWSKFPNVNTYTFNACDGAKYVNDHLNDSSTRWASILPTMIQVEQADPDIVMYGVNGDEMFFRDMTPHLHAVTLHNIPKHDTVEGLKKTIREDVASKVNMYGACYSVGDDDSAWQYVDVYENVWLRSMPKYRTQLTIKQEMFRLMTPKYYTRAISANNDVMVASLYNDRRIYHEVLKCKEEYLREEAMDSPIQRKLLSKFDFFCDTPHKDILYADYDTLHENVFRGTIQKCLEDNI